MFTTTSDLQALAYTQVCSYYFLVILFKAEVNVSQDTGEEMPEPNTTTAISTTTLATLNATTNTTDSNAIACNRTISNVRF